MDRIKVLVQKDLNRVENRLKNIFYSDTEPMSDLSDFIQGSSKRIRSILALLYLKANNIPINDNIINLLSSSELIHNASLIHDDVIDNSAIRREKQSLFGKYDSKLAVLLGDYTLSYAVDELLLINNPKITKLFLDITKQMSSAEITQYINRNKSVKIDDYLEIISGKTASLFAGIMESAALLADLDEDNAKNIGVDFGIIFQINNDQKSDSISNDRKNGVNTIVNILGIEKTQDLKDNYKKELRELLNKIPQNAYKKGIEDLIDLL